MSVVFRDRLQILQLPRCPPGRYGYELPRKRYGSCRQTPKIHQTLNAPSRRVCTYPRKRNAYSSSFLSSTPETSTYKTLGFVHIPLSG